MKTSRYAILPLFAFSLAVSAPVLAGEGDSPNVPPKDTTGSSSGAAGVDKTDDESAKLPFEKDPDENGSDSGNAANPDSGNAAPAGAAGSGDGTSTGDGGTGDTGGSGGTGSGG